MRFIGSDSCSLSDDLALHDTECQRGTARLTRPKRRVLADRIKAYYESAPDVHLINQLAAAEARHYEALRRINYRTNIAKLRAAALATAGNACPYCGAVGMPDALDHFLPKEKYPEYSVVRANLVPICSHCNNAKGQTVRDNLNRRVFRHPYYDRDLTRRLVEAKITWVDGKPYFSLRARMKLPDALRSDIHRHISASSLAERFATVGRQQFKMWMDIQQSGNPYTRAVLLYGLEQEIRRRDGIGPNNWESVVLRAILKSKRAINVLSP